MQLYFIRHGQSVNNLLWDTTSSNKGRSQDPELTPTGRRQAELLGQFLHYADPAATVVNGYDSQNVTGFGITKIYTSLMVRAVSTATIIGCALNLPVEALADLHECGGIYLEDEQTGALIGQPGHNRAYFREHYPDLIVPESCTDEGWWNRPFEADEQRQARAERLLYDLLERHGQTEDRVALVSHAGFYNYLLGAILKLPDGNRPWFILNNAALTRIDFLGDHVDLVYLNRADFLPRDLIT